MTCEKCTGDKCKESHIHVIADLPIGALIYDHEFGAVAQVTDKEDEPAAIGVRRRGSNKAGTVRGDLPVKRYGDMYWCNWMSGGGDHDV